MRAASDGSDDDDGDDGDDDPTRIQARHALSLSLLPKEKAGAANARVMPCSQINQSKKNDVTTSSRPKGEQARARSQQPDDQQSPTTTQTRKPPTEDGLQDPPPVSPSPLIDKPVSAGLDSRLALFRKVPDQSGNIRKVYTRFIK
jgi:hypothetical protein